MSHMLLQRGVTSEARVRGELVGVKCNPFTANSAKWNRGGPSEALMHFRCEALVPDNCAIPIGLEYLKSSKRWRSTRLDSLWVGFTYQRRERKWIKFFLGFFSFSLKLSTSNPRAPLGPLQIEEVDHLCHLSETFFRIPREALARSAYGIDFECVTVRCSWPPPSRSEKNARSHQTKLSFITAKRQTDRTHLRRGPQTTRLCPIETCSC